MAPLILATGIIYFIGHLLTHFFEKSKIPDVLMLIIFGILVGPVLGIAKVEEIGDAGRLFTQFALIVILFEGGLNIELRSFLRSARQSVIMTTIFFFISAATVGAIMHFGFDYSPMASILTGFICGGTSSAVVIPLLGMIKVNKGAATMLVLESAFTDVLCIVFAIGQLQSFESGAFKIEKIIFTLVSSLVIAALIGILCGYFWLTVISKVRAFSNTQFATCFCMFLVYGVAEMIGFSGAIAALAFGIMIGNAQTISNQAKRLFNTVLTVGVMTDAEKKLYKELVFLFKIFFFIYIGISIPFDNTGSILVALAVVISIFLLRPLASCFIAGRAVTPRDKTIISIMVPKGLAAAVLAGLPSQYGMAEGGDIQAITYHVVLISIVTTSVLIPLIEKTRFGTIYDSLFVHLGKTISQRELDRLTRDGNTKA